MRPSEKESTGFACKRIWLNKRTVKFLVNFPISWTAVLGDNNENQILKTLILPLKPPKMSTQRRHSSRSPPSQWTLPWLVDGKRYPTPLSETIGQNNCQSKRRQGFAHTLTAVGWSFKCSGLVSTMFFKYISAFNITYLFSNKKVGNNLSWIFLLWLIGVQRFRPTYLVFRLLFGKRQNRSQIGACLPCRQTDDVSLGRRTGWGGKGGGGQVKVLCSVAPTTQGSTPMCCWLLCFFVWSRLCVSNT